MRTIDDRLALLVYNQLGLYLLMGWVLNSRAEEGLTMPVSGDLIDSLLSTILIAVIAVIVLVLIFHTVVFARRMVRERQRNPVLLWAAVQDSKTPQGRAGRLPRAIAERAGKPAHLPPPASPTLWAASR